MEILTIDKAIEILQAFKEGKKIERRRIICVSGYSESFGPWEEWKDICMVNLQTLFSDTTCEYRIKSEPIYRPYDSASEFLSDGRSHGFWITHKDAREYYNPYYTDDSGVVMGCVSEREHNTFKELFDYFTWLDGTPCGLKV